MKWKLLNLSDNHSDRNDIRLYNYIRKLKFIMESTNKMLSKH